MSECCRAMGKRKKERVRVSERASSGSESHTERGWIRFRVVTHSLRFGGVYRLTLLDCLWSSPSRISYRRGFMKHDAWLVTVSPVYSIRIRVQHASMGCCSSTSRKGKSIWLKSKAASTTAAGLSWKSETISESYYRSLSSKSPTYVSDCESSAGCVPAGDRVVEKHKGIVDHHIASLT